MQGRVYSIINGGGGQSGALPPQGGCRKSVYTMLIIY